MKLKDVYGKYSPDYNILVFGKPLKQKTIPFSFLPSDKNELMNMEVIEMEKIEKEYIENGVRFKDLKPTKPIYRKGHIYVYVK